MKNNTVYICGYGRLPVFTWGEVCADAITYEGSEDGYDIYSRDDVLSHYEFIAVVPD